MNKKVECINSNNGTMGLGLSARPLLHPDDVLADTRISKADKKALLASWASDVRAVKDAPGCRQLDSGAIVGVDSIMRALKSLDGVIPSDRRPAERMPYYLRRHGALLSRWRNRFGRRNGPDDDNNQPPPCPAAACPPPRPASLGIGNRPEWA